MKLLGFSPLKCLMMPKPKKTGSEKIKKAADKAALKTDKKVKVKDGKKI